MTMDTLKIIDQLWAPLMAFVFLIVWLVRLEAKVLLTENKYIDLKATVVLVQAEHSKVVQQLNEIRDSLSRIEGWLDARTSKLN